jgi:hypothetical protein
MRWLKFLVVISLPPSLEEMIDKFYRDRLLAISHNLPMMTNFLRKIKNHFYLPVMVEQHREAD